MKDPAFTPPPRPSKEKLRRAIVRSVASSTALETGQPIAQIEEQLRTGGKYSHLKLAR